MNQQGKKKIESVRKMKKGLVVKKNEKVSVKKKMTA